jgi:hypothetical protein
MYRCVSDQTFFVGDMEKGAVVYTSIVGDTSTCQTSGWVNSYGPTILTQGFRVPCVFKPPISDTLTASCSQLTYVAVEMNNTDCTPVAISGT